MKAITIANKMFNRDYKTPEEFSKDLQTLIDNTNKEKYEKYRDHVKKLQNELRGYRSGKKHKRDYDAKKFNKALNQTVRQKITEIVESLQEMKLHERYEYALRIMFKDKTWALWLTNFGLVLFLMSYVLMLIKLIYGG
jgi:F0F1-type ATP synthase membrane subunit b/b'